jgi:hypothetical protein
VRGRLSTLPDDRLTPRTDDAHGGQGSEEDFLDRVLPAPGYFRGGFVCLLHGAAIPSTPRFKYVENMAPWWG